MNLLIATDLHLCRETHRFSPPKQAHPIGNVVTERRWTITYLRHEESNYE